MGVRWYSMPLSTMAEASLRIAALLFLWSWMILAPALGIAAPGANPGGPQGCGSADSPCARTEQGRGLDCATSEGKFRCFRVVQAHECAIVGNVLQCDDGLRGTKIGNVWEFSNGSRGTLVGDVLRFEGGGDVTVRPGSQADFSPDKGLKCGLVGAIEFCVKPPK